MPYLDITKKNNRENMRLKWKQNAFKMRKKRKLKSLEISRKKPLTDRKKLMLLELKEPLNSLKGTQEPEKSFSKKKNSVF